MLSKLASTAKTLNEKSDSVNDLIERFQETLRAINVGIEVWPISLGDEGWMVENRDGEDSECGSIDTELGFTKWGNEWVLATRRAFYDNTQYVNVYNFVRAEDVTPLLQESRSVRIEALEHFPEIVKALQAAAEKAIRTIEDAKKLVVGRGDAPENVESLPPGVASGNKMLMDTAAPVARQRRNG